MVDLVALRQVAAHRLVVGPDLDRVGAPNFLQGDLVCAGDFLDDLAHPVGERVQAFAVRAEHLHRHIGVDPFEHLAETNGDGLVRGQFLPRDVFLDGGEHAPGEFLLGEGGAVFIAPPLGVGLVGEVDVVLVDALRVGGDVGRADPREGVRDLGHVVQDSLLGGALHFHGSVQAHGRLPLHLHDQRAFVERRQELRAQPGERPPGQRAQSQHRQHQRQPDRRQGDPTQDRQVNPVQRAHERGRAGEIVRGDGSFLAQEGPAQRGNPRQAEHQRGEQRQRRRPGERLEHLALHAT